MGIAASALHGMAHVIRPDRRRPGAGAAAAAAYSLSFGQRALSTPARLVRRRAQSVSGTMTFADGTQTDVNEATLLRPLEVALRAFSWGVVLLGLGLVAAKLS